MLHHFNPITLALNIQTFRTRALTALVFVIVMITGLLWNHWSFFLLFSIIHFGCWYEYIRLLQKIDPSYKEISPFHQYSMMIAGWSIMLLFSGDAWHIGGMSLHTIGWWLLLVFVFAFPIAEILFTRHIRAKHIFYSVLALLYISLSWGLMMALRQYLGAVIPCGLIFSIWINDTMAYLVGSFIGKTPFSKISPKKTWEGTLGGAILCVVVIGLLGWWSGYYSVTDWMMIAAIAAITGTAGDLLESKLKRMANVKDSGSFMPGHGGFLDRFDSLLLATPFVWLYVALRDLF
jgi:phosphatidate cytidylyltransferase